MGYRTAIFGHPDIYETEGSLTPVTVTLDGIDPSKGRLWTTTTGSMMLWDGSKSGYTS